MDEPTRLTAMVKAGGCAAKLSPSLLDSLLARLPRQVDPNVLIGFDTADDAGVYRLTDDLALVQTVDFFTPIVDDPFTFGQIAAANALSDVYAMGGRPISALTLVGFPNDVARAPILEKILAGGLDKMQEAGCTVIGGHSIADDEIKFGYAVTGVVNPQRVWANAGARAGDRLVFTKKLGTGVIAAAIKKQGASAEAIAAAVESMCTLNRAACDVALEFPVHGATDVTGFSLLGHAREMALASKVSLVLDHARFELLPGALECLRRGFLSGGLVRNREFIGSCAEISQSIPEEFRNLLFDPQTSGGLLLSVEASAATELVAALRERGAPANEVGEVIRRSHPLILVK
jgi:selenide, water dikinase